MKSLGVDEYPEEVSPDEFASFDDTVAATEPVLSDKSILAMVREIEEPIEVEDDEEDGGDEDISLEKPTSIQLRSAIELYWTLVFLQSQMRFNVVPWKFLN